MPSLAGSTTADQNGHTVQEVQVPPRSQRLAGKVAIVTGGSAGFGEAITSHFVAAGAKVVVIDIDAEKGRCIQERNPDSVYFLRGDVTSAQTWSEAGRIALEHFGGLTTIVNNAGMSYEPKPVHQHPLGLYDKVFNLNVRPIFLSISVLAESLMKARGASCINISSTGYTRPRPGFAFYNASKAAVTTATKTMALEYAPSIRFNAISPALGNTNMLQVSISQYADPQARLQDLCKSIPMGRPTEPSDVAAAAVYLASDEAGFVTGTLLEVDGGRGV